MYHVKDIEDQGAEMPMRQVFVCNCHGYYWARHTERPWESMDEGLHEKYLNMARHALRNAPQHDCDEDLSVHEATDEVRQFVHEKVLRGE